MTKYKRAMTCLMMICITAFLAGCSSRQVFGEGEPVESDVSVDKQVKMVDNGPEQGGSLNLPVTAVDTLNPYQTRNRYVFNITFFVYESLFIQTAENQAEPYLVTECQNQDFTLWSFTLQQEAYFHHGQQLTAYDVRHSMRVLEGSDSPFYNTGIFDNIKSIDVINSTRFEIQLKEADELFNQKLVFPILPQTLGSGKEDFLIGTGPYRFDHMDETSIKLVRNEEWWQEKPAYLDSIVFKVYPENKIMDVFQNNELDVAFIKNVDFTKYRHRTDILYQVYPESEGSFLYVNPDSLFGQSNRQKALFRYVLYRINDLNPGQVQYFDGYMDSPIDIEGFRAALVGSGLLWNENRKLFTSHGKALSKVSIVVPLQDLQKLNTANFLVNILEDAGVPAEIKAVQTPLVKNLIRNGSYDLSPVTEELKPWETLDDTLQRMQDDLGYGRDNSYILPLYRNQQAILFKNDIRGEKKAFYWNPYQGFQTWYRPAYTEGGLKE